MKKSDDGNFLLFRHENFIRFKSNIGLGYIYEPMKNSDVFTDIVEIREYKLPKLDSEILNSTCISLLIKKYDCLLVEIGDDKIYIFEDSSLQELLKTIDDFYKKRKIDRTFNIIDDVDRDKVRIMNLCRTESNHAIHKDTYNKIRRVYDYCQENFDKEEIRITSDLLKDFLGIKRKDLRNFAVAINHIKDCGFNLILE